MLISRNYWFTKTQYSVRRKSKVSLIFEKKFVKLFHIIHIMDFVVEVNFTEFLRISLERNYDICATTILSHKFRQIKFLLKRALLQYINLTKKFAWQRISPFSHYAFKWFHIKFKLNFKSVLWDKKFRETKSSNKERNITNWFHEIFFKFEKIHNPVIRALQSGKEIERMILLFYELVKLIYKKNHQFQR